MLPADEADKTWSVVAAIGDGHQAAAGAAVCCAAAQLWWCNSVMVQVWHSSCVVLVCVIVCRLRSPWTKSSWAADCMRQPVEAQNQAADRHTFVHADSMVSMAPAAQLSFDVVFMLCECWNSVVVQICHSSFFPACISLHGCSHEQFCRCLWCGLLPAESLDQILIGRWLYEATCRGAEPGSRPLARYTDFRLICLLSNRRLAALLLWCLVRGCDGAAVVVAGLVQL
jgi:hypothetical protein